MDHWSSKHADPSGREACESVENNTDAVLEKGCTRLTLPLDATFPDHPSSRVSEAILSIRRSGPDTRYLCEIALVAKAFHTSELRTQTFADVLTLTGVDLARCIRGSPRCIGVVYRYANQLLTSVSSFLQMTEIDAIPKKVAKDVKAQLKRNNISVTLNFESRIASDQDTYGRS